MKWQIIKRAQELSDQWDELAGDNIFLRRPFLEHLERVNPCGQTYNLLIEANQVKAIFIDYRLKLDIFTYSFFSWKIPVTIMGIPCSVAKEGYSVFPGYEKHLLAYFQKKKGARLILNSPHHLPAKGGNTLPTCKMKIEWLGFEEYLNALRSPYRYRVKKALSKWQDIKVEFPEPRAFDLEFYKLYEEVFANSEAKLEKLKIDFFKKLPLNSIIISASQGEEKLGFVQLIKNGTELIFLFIGFNHSLNKAYDIYLNLLLEIIRFALDNGFKTIDFGQTAEETKLKLGCRLFPKKMYLGHSNYWLNKLGNKYINVFTYEVPKYNFRVFKQVGDRDEGIIG